MIDRDEILMIVVAEASKHGCSLYPMKRGGDVIRPVQIRRDWCLEVAITATGTNGKMYGVIIVSPEDHESVVRWAAAEMAEKVREAAGPDSIPPAVVVS